MGRPRETDYETLTREAYDEQGGKDFVVDHNITAAGWRYMEMGIAEMFVIAALAGVVLFWPFDGDRR